MSKQFTAAVIREKGGSFLSEQVSRISMRDDEVLVRVLATEMCHTNMIARDQVFPVPQSALTVRTRLPAKMAEC